MMGKARGKEVVLKNDCLIRSITRMYVIGGSRKTAVPFTICTLPTVFTVFLNLQYHIKSEYIKM